MTRLYKQQIKKEKKNSPNITKATKCIHFRKGALGSNPRVLQIFSYFLKYFNRIDSLVMLNVQANKESAMKSTVNYPIRAWVTEWNNRTEL